MTIIDQGRYDAARKDIGDVLDAVPEKHDLEFRFQTEYDRMVEAVLTTIAARAVIGVRAADSLGRIGAARAVLQATAATLELLKHAASDAGASGASGAAIRGAVDDGTRDAKNSEVHHKGHGEHRE